MGANNKVITNIKIAKVELEARMNMRLDEFKYETVISIDMKLSDLSSHKPSYSYDRPSADCIKWPLLKSPRKHPMHQTSPNIYIP